MFARRLRGFTLIELLVVITIIGVLVSMLLPAVQAARESARRAQCSNNLKQIGLALHNYHSQHNVFPAGYIATVGTAGPADDKGPGWGWSTAVLSFLELNNVYDTIHFDKDIVDSSNAAMRTTSLPAFLCASDGGDRTFKVDSLDDSTSDYSTPLKDSDGNPVLVAHGNYVGVFGNPEITPDLGFLSTDPDRGVAHRGMFYRNVGVRSAGVRDGTSNTLFVGERSSNLAHATWTGGQCPNLKI